MQWVSSHASSIINWCFVHVMLNVLKELSSLKSVIRGAWCADSGLQLAELCLITRQLFMWTYLWGGYCLEKIFRTFCFVLWCVISLWWPLKKIFSKDVRDIFKPFGLVRWPFVCTAVLRPGHFCDGAKRTTFI